MNPASVLIWQDTVTLKMILAACIAGIQFDIIHALGTAVFLWFLSTSLIEKLERVKLKYGLISEIRN